MYVKCSSLCRKSRRRRRAQHRTSSTSSSSSSSESEDERRFARRKSKSMAKARQRYAVINILIIYGILIITSHVFQLSSFNQGVTWLRSKQTSPNKPLKLFTIIGLNVTQKHHIFYLSKTLNLKKSKKNIQFFFSIICQFTLWFTSSSWIET